MKYCPLCTSAQVIKAASSSLEVYCGSCRNILISESLGFRFASEEPEACSRDGLPGYKGPGESAKCYTYDPGDEAQEKRARAKASQSAYMEERRMKSSSIVESIAFFTEAPSKIVEGIDYTEEDEPKIASDVLQRIIPSTVQTEDGVEVSGNEDIGSGITPIATRSFHPAFINEKDDFSSLGRSYCTSCGGDHEFGFPCS